MFLVEFRLKFSSVLAESSYSQRKGIPISTTQADFKNGLQPIFKPPSPEPEACPAMTESDIAPSPDDTLSPSFAIPSQRRDRPPGSSMSPVEVFANPLSPPTAPQRHQSHPHIRTAHSSISQQDKDVSMRHFSTASNFSSDSSFFSPEMTHENTGDLGSFPLLPIFGSNTVFTNLAPSYTDVSTIHGGIPAIDPKFNDTNMSDGVWDNMNLPRDQEGQRYNLFGTFALGDGMSNTQGPNDRMY